MINESLARWAELAIEAAFAGYIMALVCLGIEFASRRATVATAAEAASAELRAARASARKGGTALLEPPGQDAPQIGHVTKDRERPSLGTRFGWSGMVVLTIGFVAHVAALVLRGFAAGRVPWGNLYEITSVICAFAVAAYLVMHVRGLASRAIGFFAMIAVVILMFFARTVLYTEPGTLVPALNSYWLVIHVVAVASSAGVLLLPGAASVMYLLRSRYENKLAKAKAFAAANDEPLDERVMDRSLWAALPSLATLDKVAYRVTIVAFPVFTFGILAGAMWAEAAWGRYWGWDPKETVSFISWVLYAAYLHARSTAGWRGVKSAWISVLAFASMIFNLFFINMVVSGLHSYAGLN